MLAVAQHRQALGAPKAAASPAAWGAFSLPEGTAVRPYFETAAHGLFWLAALVTLITGAQYWEQTRKALAD